MTSSGTCHYFWRGTRTVRATAAAVGPWAARRRAGGARTVRATVAAAFGSGSGGGGDKMLSTISSSHITENENERKPNKRSFRVFFTMMFYSFTQNDPTVDTHIFAVGFRQHTGKMTSSGKDYIFQK